MPDATVIVDETERHRSNHVAWLSWRLGPTLLIAVIAAALHSSEQRAFVHVAQEAKPAMISVFHPPSSTTLRLSLDSDPRIDDTRT